MVVRFVGLELNYTLLESIRGKCGAGEGTVSLYGLEEGRIVYSDVF